MADKTSDTKEYLRARRAKYNFAAAAIIGGLSVASGLGYGAYSFMTHESPMDTAITNNDMGAVRDILAQDADAPSEIKAAFEGALRAERFELAAGISAHYQLAQEILMDAALDAIDYRKVERYEALLSMMELSDNDIRLMAMKITSEGDASQRLYEALMGQYGDRMSAELHGEVLYKELDDGKSSSDFAAYLFEGPANNADILYDQIVQARADGDFDASIVPFLEKYDLYDDFMLRIVRDANSPLFNSMWRDEDVSWAEYESAMQHIAQQGYLPQMQRMANIDSSDLFNRTEHKNALERIVNNRHASYVADLIFPNNAELNQALMHAIQDQNITDFMRVMGDGDVSAELVEAAFQKALEDANAPAALIFVEYFGLSHDTLMAGLNKVIAGGDGLVADALLKSESITGEMVLESVRSVIAQGFERQAMTAAAQMDLDNDVKEQLREMFDGSVVQVLNRAWDARP
jgi:hypothetical protein